MDRADKKVRGQINMSDKLFPSDYSFSCNIYTQCHHSCSMFEQRETLWYQWHQCVKTAQNVNLRRKGLWGFYFAFFLEVVKNKTSDDAFSEGVLFVHRRPVTGLHRGVQPMACRLELAHGTVLSCLAAFLPPTSLGPQVRGNPLISNAQAELPNS